MIRYQFYVNDDFGGDDYHFQSREQELAKFNELKQQIREMFAHCSKAQCMDEPDFFGILDFDSQSWAKVYLDP